MNLQALVLCCIAAGNTLAQAQVVEIKNTVPSTPPIATEAPAVSEDFTVLEQEMLDLINEARETAGLPPAQANKRTMPCARWRRSAHRKSWFRFRMSVRTVPRSI